MTSGRRPASVQERTLVASATSLRRSSVAAAARSGAVGVNVAQRAHQTALAERDTADRERASALDQAARANAVRDLLAALGVQDDKFLIRGAGETAPIGDNATPEGRAANRRIEFELTPV